MAINIIITGANSQLAKAISYACHYKQFSSLHLSFLTKEQLDITNEDNVTRTLEILNPDFVINTAAIHDLAYCEKHKREAGSVNVTGVYNLFNACNRINAKLVQISSDYVFGEKTSRIPPRPFKEEDPRYPMNYYGLTKAWGENIVLSNDNNYVVRISSLFSQWGSRSKNNTNFVLSMIKRVAQQDDIRVVNDVIMSPTFAVHAAVNILSLIKDDMPGGIYHANNGGECSWYDFTMYLFALMNVKIPVKAIQSHELPSESQWPKRPRYSALDNSKIQSIGIFVPTWQEALEEYVKMRDKQ